MTNSAVHTPFINLNIACDGSFLVIICNKEAFVWFSGKNIGGHSWTLLRDLLLNHEENFGVWGLVTLISQGKVTKMLFTQVFFK